MKPIPAAPMLVRADDVAPRPWANGGGQTRELLALPPGGDWRLRISLASVAGAGPFSPYPGVERWFAVVAGAGVTLVVGGEPHRLERGSPPLRFDGAATVDCDLLGGPTVDLNLMLRGLCGRMLGAQAGEAWRPARAQCGLYAAGAGRCRTRGADGSIATVDVPADALLWFGTAPAELGFDFAPVGSAGAAAAWWLEADAIDDPESQANADVPGTKPLA